MQVSEAVKSAYQSVFKSVEVGIQVSKVSEVGIQIYTSQVYFEVGLWV